MSLSQAEFNELMQLGRVYFYRKQDAFYYTTQTKSTFQQANIALRRLCDRVDALQLGVLHDFYFFGRPSVQLHQEIKNFESQHKAPNLSEVSASGREKFVDAKAFEEQLSAYINTSFNTKHSFTKPQAFSAVTHYSSVTGPALLGGTLLIVACAVAIATLNPALPVGVLLLSGMLLGSAYLAYGIGKTASEIMFSSPAHDDDFVSSTLASVV